MRRASSRLAREMHIRGIAVYTVTSGHHTLITRTLNPPWAPQTLMTPTARRGYYVSQQLRTLLYGGFLKTMGLK